MIIIDLFDKVRKLDMELCEVGEELYIIKQKIRKHKKIFNRIKIISDKIN